MRTLILKSNKLLGIGLLLCIILFSCNSCSQDEDVIDTPPPNNGVIQEQAGGVTFDELNPYQGDLGLRVYTRTLARRGFEPAKAELDFTTSNGDYDQMIDIDPYTNIGQLLFAKESLSEAAIEELKDGVALTIKILNEANQQIASKTFQNARMLENGNDLSIESSDATTTVSDDFSLAFKKDMPMFIQIVNSDGSFSNRVVNKSKDDGMGNALLYDVNTEFADNLYEYQNYFVKLPNDENTFIIYNRDTNHLLEIDDNDNTFRQSPTAVYTDGIENGALNNRYKFKVKKEENGLFTINRYSGIPLKREFNGSIHYWRAISAGEIQYFRIIALNVDWDVEELDTEHLDPIFPPASGEFVVNSTLVNCSSGLLSQTVEAKRTVTRSISTSFDETISLSARATASVDVTVGASAGVNFFGNGGEISGSVSVGLEVSVEAERSTTAGTSNSITESDEYTNVRQVDVAAGKATQVYDVFQRFENVKIPYVKRLRLSAKQINPNNQNPLGSLTGQEIATQLKITGFSGVITDIYSEAVELTVEGTLTLTSLAQFQSKATDVAANCPN